MWIKQFSKHWCRAADGDAQLIALLWLNSLRNKIKKKQPKQQLSQRGSKWELLNLAVCTHFYLRSFHLALLCLKTAIIHLTSSRLDRNRQILEKNSSQKHLAGGKLFFFTQLESQGKTFFKNRWKIPQIPPVPDREWEEKKVSQDCNFISKAWVRNMHQI